MCQEQRAGFRKFLGITDATGCGTDGPGADGRGVNTGAAGRPGDNRAGAAATVEVEVREHHLNPLGGVHGGVVAALVDSAMGNAVRDSLDEGQRGVTVALTVTYLEPATEGDRLAATAQVRRRGGRIVVAEADVVRAADGAAVAHAVGTFTPVSAQD